MQVEIWSDVVCPWCAIGKVRFERALADFAHADEVEVRWRSFELDPSRPATTDVDYVAMLAAKYRTSTEQAQAMVDRMTAAGAEAGVEFRFDRARPGNTFDAHRLLHLAADRDRQHAVKDRFLAGYHTEGAAIADHDVLAGLAVEAGLDADEVRDVLGSDAYADAVRADEDDARALGISGVPYFVVDRTYGVSGAQPADVLAGLLARARQEAGPDAHADRAATRHHDHEHGDACHDGACAV